MEYYATLGPGCDNEEVLYQMFQQGMTGIRLNLSHASLPEASDSIQRFFAAAKRVGKEPQLLIDLQGPELRTTNSKESIVFSEGESIHNPPFPKQVLAAMEPGDTILCDDGKLSLKVQPDNSCLVVRGGTLYPRKSVKIIGKTIRGEVLTQQDRQNLKYAGQYGVTAVMQPFVTSKEQLIEVRMVMAEYGVPNLRLFAKIETREGSEHLSELIPYCDMIVIARGDLGNDVPLWDLPVLQSKIAAKCRAAGRDFLVVTQMLDSMTHHPVPTRAEVSDIFRAVREGSAAVMVTGETAAGDYPVEVMRYLVRTGEAALRLPKSIS